MPEEIINITIEDSNEAVNITVDETTEQVNITISDGQVTNTSELINDGADGVHPFITLEDIPASAVESVTGDLVDNTDPANPVINNPTLAEVLAEGNLTGGENIVINDADAIQLEYASTLKKGTYDFGAAGGISRICGVGYEDMWQSGFRHVFDSNGLIRNTTNGFNIVPDSSFDVTLRFKIDSFWTLDNGDTYKCTDATEGAAVWELVNIGIIPTLQQVTDAGNESSNDIEVNSLGLYSNAVVDYGYLSWADDLGLSFKNHTTQEVLNANKSDSSLSFINADDFTAKLDATLLTDNRTFILPDVEGTIALTSDIPAAGVTSVGLTMPSAFTVTNSPITSSGDIAVTGAGLVSQYVRGDGTLANFPASTGGGASLSFYLNGSVSQGTIGGIAFREMDRTPIFGAGTDFTINANGYIQSFITDAGVPNQLEIPAGNWNFETYFSASSGGGSPSFYVELYKWNGTTLSLIASNSATPEGITNGTAIDAYFSALAVPQTSLLATDRLAIRIYVNHSGRTIKLHTENSHLSQIITTFSSGITALNGLTTQVQNLAVGTSGTDFAISSATDTHTFNLPTASAINRGALSSADWTTFNNKQTDLGFTPENVANKQTDLTASATKYPTVNAVNTGLALKQNTLSYTPYKNIQTSQSAITATVAETIVFTATIPAGAFNSVDVLKILYGANKTTALGTFTIRLRINTSNTLTGAPTIAINNATATAQMDIMMRNFNLNGGNLYGLAPGSSSLTDILASGTGLSSTPLNPANTFYIFATVQLSNPLDNIIGNMLSIHN